MTPKSSTSASARTNKVRAPKQRRSKAKVSRILRAAAQCFAESGYSRTTMARIARQARVSVGTVYAYFTDKDDVLRHLLAGHVEEIIRPAERLMAELPARATLSGTLRAVLERSLAAYAARGDLHQVFLERVSQDSRLRALSLGFRERGLAIGRKIVEHFAGPAARADEEATAQLLIGILEFCTQIGLKHPSLVTPQRASAVAIEMITCYFMQPAR